MTAKQNAKVLANKGFKISDKEFYILGERRGE
jgi:hypothetical protein